MSRIDILVEVIDEIHEVERSLAPGDIPDRIIFRHVKTLWQLLLGIQETEFDSHNYELFEFSIGNLNQKFTGFTYIGANRENIENNINNAIGSPRESLKVVQSLDAQQETNPEETSISFKLSLLNKIRYIIFEHHVFVGKFLKEHEIESIILSYMRNDILNMSNELSISLKSNNAIFNKCYKEGLESLLYDDEDILIEDMAKRIFESFKIKASLAYFFDYALLLRYHNQIVELLKRVFKNHDFVGEEIDSFYRNFPVLPILQPIYRKMTLQNINNEIKEEINDINNKNESHLIQKLDVTLLKEILNEVSVNELQQLQNIPITMKWFPQIVQHYCDALMDDGIIDYERDIFIMMIKKVVLQWVDNEISTQKFIVQLCDLSLIPTAMPYFFQGTMMPTIYMRMALYSVKESIRLRETYFDLWHSRVSKNIDFNKQCRRWNVLVGKKYLQKWKVKFETHIMIESFDISSLNIIKVNSFFQRWKIRIDKVKENEIILEKKIVRDYFGIWDLKVKKYQKMIRKSDNLLKHKLLMKYMTTWVSAKAYGFPEILNMFYDNKRRIYFYFWKSLSKTMNLNYAKADEFFKRNKEQLYFNIWSKKAATPLLELKYLESVEKKFVLNKQFKTWKLKIRLLSLENDYQISSSKALMKRYFFIWCQLKKLNSQENLVKNTINMKLSEKYIKRWILIYKMNKKADDFITATKLTDTLQIWKLRCVEMKVGKQHNFAVLKRSLDLWKLKATASQYAKCKENMSLEKHFIVWFQKATSITERLEDCATTYPILKVATYFDHWKNMFKKLQEDVYTADKFREEKIEYTNMMTLRWMLNTMKTTYRDLRRKRLELNRVERVYQKRIIQKYFNKMKLRKRNNDTRIIQAGDFNRLIVSSKYFDLWLAKFDQISALNELFYSKFDTDNVNLIMRIFSKMQLRMIKVRTDQMNADKFKERWHRLKTKTFFELWKFKQTSRSSPTPTARGNIFIENDSSSLASAPSGRIPDLNPYIDLAPRARGSPEYRPYQSKMKSVLTGNISEYEIKQKLADDDDDDAIDNGGIQTPLFGRSRATPSRFRTPNIRRSNSRLLNIEGNLRYTPDTVNTTLTSAERVRKKNLEERVSRYRMLRSPPKNNSDKLDKVEESINEEQGFNNSSIFETSFESLTSTTTMK